MLNRRLLLQATGAGAALTWLGCGGPDTTRAPALPSRPSPGRLRAHLRDVVARLCGTYAHASALAVVFSHGAAAMDSAARDSRRHAGAVLVLSARDRAGRRVERVSQDLGELAIESELMTLLGGRPGRTAAVDFGAAIDDDGIRGPFRDGLAQIRELSARADRAGSSRLVYRGAYIEIDDADVLLVAPGCDRRQRRVQSRYGVVLAAWRGRELVAGEASVAVDGPIDTTALTDAAIEAAAERALELVTPGTPPTGAGVVVLDPGIVAAIAEAAVADLMTPGPWQAGAATARSRGLAVGSAHVTISDNPTTSVAGYAFDDDGRASRSVMLIDRGVVGAPLADLGAATGLEVAVTPHARRPGHGGPLAARPCHVATAPGTTPLPAIIGGVDVGLLLEGAVAVHVDPVSWRAVVRVARARRIARGALTGHVHANLELRADIPALLASVAAASDTVVTAARRVVVDGGHLWRATSAPHWLARGVVVPGRRQL